LQSKVDQSGHIVADDPLNEAREILRLIDAGDEQKLNAYLSSLWQRKRREATLEVLGADETKSLEPAI
jgi:hypothetical protein